MTHKILDISQLTVLDEELREREIELTHWLDEGEEKVYWGTIPGGFWTTLHKVVYIGECVKDGPRFIAYEEDAIYFCKGRLL